MFSLLYCVYVCMTFVCVLLCVFSLYLHLDCVCIWIDHTPVCVHVHVCVRVRGCDCVREKECGKE